MEVGLAGRHGNHARRHAGVASENAIETLAIPRRQFTGITVLVMELISLYVKATTITKTYPCNKQRFFEL